MNTMKVNVIRGQNLNKGEITTYVGVVSASVLAKLADFPWRNATTGKGYQRQPNQGRINKLSQEIRSKSVDLPTSVLLSIRGDDLDRLVDINNDVGTIDFSKLLEEEQKIYVVDGQHRIRALQKAAEEMEDNPNLKIPFVCMLGTDENSEMDQFYIVNKNAKSVPTDLAYSLMRSRAENDPDLAKKMEHAGRKWEIEADELATEISKSQEWQGRIRLANEPKANTLVPVASFIKSLRSLLTHSPIFESLSKENRIKLICAFWRSVNKYINTEDENIEFKSLALHKGIGVSVLHAILPTLIEHARSGGNSIYKTESYNEILHPALDALEGTDGDGESVSGLNFWISGRGAVGSYSSEQGKRILIGMLKKRLPELHCE